MKLRSLSLLCLTLLLQGAAVYAANDFPSRPEGFRDRYTLSEAVVLSRHNIRSPLSGPGSVLSRITPHEWFSWTSAPGELSRKGAVLETQMG